MVAGCIYADVETRSATLPAEICWWMLRGAQALAHAAHLVEMFDQLGWADDDPRER